MYDKMEIKRKGKYTKLCGTVEIEVEDDSIFIHVIERALIEDGFNVHTRTLGRNERGTPTKVRLGVSREREI